MVVRKDYFKEGFGRHWRNYQLGDAFINCCSDDTEPEWRYNRWYKQYEEEYKYSTIFKYLSLVKDYNKHPDIGLLSDLYKAYHIPSNDTLVIHIRMGDVLGEIEDVEKHWYGIPTKGSNHYVKTKTFYDNVTIPETINQIVIVGSDIHDPYKNDGAEIYTNLIQTYFIQRGFPTTYRTPYATPDDDFAYASSASYFLHSGGGYSNTIARVVEYRNNTVLGGQSY